MAQDKNTSVIVDAQESSLPSNLAANLATALAASDEEWDQALANMISPEALELVQNAKEAPDRTINAE